MRRDDNSGNRFVEELESAFDAVFLPSIWHRVGVRAQMLGQVAHIEFDFDDITTTVDLQSGTISVDMSRWFGIGG